MRNRIGGDRAPVERERPNVTKNGGLRVEESGALRMNVRWSSQVEVKQKVLAGGAAKWQKAKGQTCRRPLQKLVTEDCHRRPSQKSITEDRFAYGRLSEQVGRRIRGFRSCKAANRRQPVELASPTGCSTARWSMSCSSGQSRPGSRSTGCRRACTVFWKRSESSKIRTLVGGLETFRMLKIVVSEISVNRLKSKVTIWHIVCVQIFQIEVLHLSSFLLITERLWF